MIESPKYIQPHCIIVFHHHWNGTRCKTGPISDLWGKVGVESVKYSIEIEK